MTYEFIKVVSHEEIDSVIQLANIIWPEHYTSIIGAEQVEYMLSSFHSHATIAAQVISKEYQYFLINNDNKAVGYLGVKLESSSVFLSKLYLLAEFRGSGVGGKAIRFIKDLALANHLDKISLTVNKYNVGAIGAYKKIGFQVTEEIVADIGEGYVMDDYKMELKL